MKTENQASWPPDGAAFTYPRHVFVLGVFDHDNASGGGVRGRSPSLPSRAEVVRRECTAPFLTAGHRRSCKHAGPRRLIHPSASSVGGMRAAGGGESFPSRRCLKKTNQKKKIQRIPDAAPI